MRRTLQPSSTSDLFDLPLLLDPPGGKLAEPETTEPVGPEPSVEPALRKLGEPAAAPAPKPEPEPEQIALPGESEHSSAASAGGDVRRRLVAGLLDLAVDGAAVLVAIAGAAALGAPPRLAQWPAYALVGLTLSFVYAVYSLSFWGRTPGMARARLSARTANGGPINFGQAVGRWLGGVVTVGLLGLPILLLVRGHASLADALSGTRLEG